MSQINFWGKIWKILNLIGCLIWFNQSYDTRLAAVCCQLELAVAKHYKRWSLSLHWNHCQILPDFLRNPGIVTFDDTQFGFIKREKVGAGSHEMLGRAGEAWNIPNHWAGLVQADSGGNIRYKRHNKLRSADLPSYPHTLIPHHQWPVAIIGGDEVDIKWAHWQMFQWHVAWPRPGRGMATCPVLSLSLSHLQVPGTGL